jgi:hypothetical protein
MGWLDRLTRRGLFFKKAENPPISCFRRHILSLLWGAHNDRGFCRGKMRDNLGCGKELLYCEFFDQSLPYL